MRYISYILIFVILSSCSIQKKKSLNEEGLSAYTEMYKLLGETSVDTNEFKAVKIYSYDFEKNGKVKDSTLVKYENLFFFFLKYRDHTNYYITYDSLGREFERYATIIGSGTHLDYRNTYDENSNIKERTGFNGRDGQINSKIYYYYDSLNRLVKEEYYVQLIYEQPKLEKGTTTIYEYQDSILSKKIQWNNYIDNNGLNPRWVQEYNSNNRLIDYKIETIENDSIASFWGFKLFYDNNGKLIKKHHYGSDKKNLQTEYKYNSSGLPIEVFSWQPDNQEPTRLIRYFYEGQRKTTHNSSFR